MLSFLWAFGSTLIILLILTVLRIGFSFAGKLSVALTGFVVALVGLTTVNTLPLWQTGLILLLLALVVTYVMDTRYGTVIYSKEMKSFDEEEFEYAVSSPTVEKPAELELLDVNIETVELPILTDKEEKQMHLAQEQPKAKLEESNFELDSRDLLTLETEQHEETEITEDILSEEGYLAGIENLLHDESAEITSIEDEDWLEEVNDFEVSKKEEEIVVIEESDEHFLEELFLAAEEAAAGTEKAVKYKDIERGVKLQK